MNNFFKVWQNVAHDGVCKPFKAFKDWLWNKASVQVQGQFSRFPKPPVLETFSKRMLKNQFDFIYVTTTSTVTRLGPMSGITLCAQGRHLVIIDSFFTLYIEIQQLRYRQL